MKDWVKEILWQLGFIAFVFGCPLLVWFLLEALI
jgi:hypothetical protein